MATITIDLPDALTAQLAQISERSSVTAHDFIVAAIAEKIAQDDALSDFDVEAQESYAELLASGKSIPLADVRHYFERRIAGEAVASPVPKKFKS